MVMAMAMAVVVIVIVILFESDRRRFRHFGPSAECRLLGFIQECLDLLYMQTRCLSLCTPTLTCILVVDTHSVSPPEP